MFECHALAKQYDLRLLIAAEAYWVKDRFEKDRSNCHIWLGAKNENGRQALNDVLSEANITGFYYQPRLDLALLLSLPADDIWVTTACLAFWKYEDVEEIVQKLYSHFGANFYLEVQYHNTEKQKEVNRRIVDLSNKYNIPIIMGCDSHYIHPEQEAERTSYLNSKNLFYEDEEGWFLDYPAEKEAFNRFKRQNILTDPQINEAISNTNVFLEVEPYTSPIFNDDVKMPTLYPDKSKSEKDKMFVDLIWKLAEQERKHIPTDKWAHYKSEIEAEVDVIVATDHADYFLLDYALVKRAKELGGTITPTGRGSGSSMYINKLLGFTTVDRISAPVPLIPERFMSKSRILEAKSIADLDLNTANPEIFAQAQSELLGQAHAYPIIAFGTLQARGAWKMYARSNDIDANISNDVSKQINKYEVAKRYAETDEEKDAIDISKYIDSAYLELFEGSKKYLGVIDNIKQHPCGYLLYSGDIRREIGLVRIKPAGKDPIICALMDGKYIERHKFLKNDLLKVSVVDLIDRVFKRIGKPMLTADELLSLCQSDPKVWDVYAMAATHGVNQCEQTSTAGRVAQYKPQNISELTAFIAAIRPGAKTIFKDFTDRVPFSYDIQALDDLIQTKEFPYSFILYQETQMQILSYAGIPMDQTYEIIKSISKKRIDQIMSHKEQFIQGFEQKVMTGNITDQAQATDVSHKVWQIIEDSASYIFNAAHAYCVAIDSLYGAYLKSHYPLQFYEVFLKLLEEKSEKDRMASTKEEAERAYGIVFPQMKFRQDNREIALDADKNEITNSLKSIKGFSKNLADFLYTMKDMEFPYFVDLLKYIEDNSTLSTRIGDLIKIQYFSEFGENGRLVEIFEEFKGGKSRYNKNHKDATKEKRLMALRELEDKLASYPISIKDQMAIEIEKLGYIQCTYPELDKRNCVVMEVDTKYAPRIQLYNLHTGKSQSFKMATALYKNRKIVLGDIIYVSRFKEKPALKKIDGKFVEQDEKQWWIEQFQKVNHLFE